MSCGDEHETDCNEVLAEVWLFLDQECNQMRRDLLRQHLDECHPCLAQYGIEEKLKELLARKCGGEQRDYAVRHFCISSSAETPRCKVCSCRARREASSSRRRSG